MPLTISDEDQPTDEHGSRFRVIIILPEFVKRLIERIRRWIGGA
jgi:hypothetical protein